VKYAVKITTPDGIDVFVDYVTMTPMEMHEFGESILKLHDDLGQSAAGID